MRDSCIFYRSFFEAIKELPKENQADVYNAIFEHSLNFNEIELIGINKTIMTLIKPQLDANIKRFENGKKPKQKQNESKTEANNNVNVNNNKNVNNNILLKKETKDVFSEIEILPLNNQEPKRKKVAPKKEINLPNEFIEIWDLWLEYRTAKKIKNYANDKFEQMAIDKLLKFSNNNPIIAKEIINESITNSWTGFFELKNKIVEPIIAGRQTLSTIQKNSDWSMIENPYEKK